MKKLGTITGLCLLIFLTCNFYLQAQQRGMRGMMMDSVRMNRMGRGLGMRQDRSPDFRTDSLGMRHIRPGMGPFGLNPMRPKMFPGPEFGMRGWMWPGPMLGRMGRGFGNGMMMNRMRNGMGPMYGERMTVQGHRPGMRMFGNIPDLTDKQKKSIDELMLKQQDEMKKFRDEMMTKMKSLRESHRAKIMDLLAPEQKKWVEENTENPPEK
jgi:hypothetical protein